MINQHQQRLYDQINAACSQSLKNMLQTLVSDEDHFTLKQLRGSARNFTGTELQKELAALAGRLVRCRQALQRIERQIERHDGTEF